MEGLGSLILPLDHFIDPAVVKKTEAKALSISVLNFKTIIYSKRNLT